MVAKKEKEKCACGEPASFFHSGCCCSHFEGVIKDNGKYIACENCGKICAKLAEKKDVAKSDTYRKVLKHRMKCKKWGKEFCLECFGGGLTKFTKDLEGEYETKS